MPYDLGVIKRQRREPPVISTSTYGGNFVGFYSTGIGDNINYYAVHVFTSSGQFTKPSYVTTTTAQVLVVAGGGGGGLAGGISTSPGGGGGAGGVINSSTYSITATLTILIGAGGPAAGGDVDPAIGTGSASTVTNGVTILVASGGGRGGYNYSTGIDPQASGGAGGSGGGGSYAGFGLGGASTSTQGNIGGTGNAGYTGSPLYAGGGGGAGAVGGSANASASGQGGSGTITLITGSPIWLAGGGGGGANATGYNNGSYGGGGPGGTTSAVAGVAGTTNSGGGGGGGGGTTGAGGSGGSGIVIISYAIPANLYPINQSDPYFGNNSLLLNSLALLPAASLNKISSIISDLSLNQYAVTNNGSLTGKLNPFAPGPYHSLYFNGNNFISIATINAMPATTTDFTVEFWMYTVSSDNITNHWLIGTIVTNGFYVFHRNNYINIGQVGVITYTSPAVFSLNQWTHVAIVRASNIFYIYQNGTSVFTQSWNPTLVAGGVYIGGASSQNAFHTGYLSNVRVVSSVVYTGNFAIPTEPLSTVQNASSNNISVITAGTTLLTGRFATTSTSIVDYSTLTNSMVNFGVTPSSLNPFNNLNSYSVSFNNSSLSATKTNGWVSGNYTVEAWVYLNTVTNASNSMLIAGTYGYGNIIPYMFGWELTINNYLITLNFQSDTTGYNPIKIKTLATTAINTGGQLLTDISLYNAPLNISSNLSQSLESWIFPTNPFNNRYGSFANMAMYNSLYNFNYGPVSRPRMDTIPSFDGATRTFTLEAWIFMDPNLPVFNLAGPIIQGVDWAFGIGNNGTACKLQFVYRRWNSSSATRDFYPYLEGPNNKSMTSTASVPIGQWVHVAFVKNVNPIYPSFYINGVQEISNTGFYYTGGDYMNPDNTYAQVGGVGLLSYVTTGNIGTTGYLDMNAKLFAFISNVRLVQGVAVYTGNFTVPTDNLTITQSSGTNISAIVSNTATTLLTAVTTASITQQVFSTSTWYHVAFTKSSNIVSLYVNGVGYASLTLPDSNFQEKNILQIGKSYSPNNIFLGTFYGTPLYGNISNFRIVNGTVVYPGNFTVPNGPLQLTQVANAYGGTNTAAISNATSVTFLTAKYYSYVGLLLGFNDAGSNNLVVTPTGNPGQGTFSPFGNNWSMLFNGTTDHLSIPIANSSNSGTSFALAFNNNNWTIETWAYLTANAGTAYIAGQYNTSNYSPLGLYITGNKPAVGVSNAGTLWNINPTSPNVLSTGTWNHIAAVRNGGRYSLYVNGIEQIFAVSSVPTVDNSVNAGVLVATNTINSALNPFDQSIYNSLYFDGGSYLNLSANAGYNFGTGDFTIECWIYPLAYVVGSATASEIIDLWSNASGSFIVGQWQIQISAAGLIQFPYATGAAGAATLTSIAIITLNAWSHVAVVRSGSAVGNLKIYLNGAVVATSAGAVIQNIGSTGAGSIGKQTNVASIPYCYNGYISNVRIVKGQALYTASFVPPASSIGVVQVGVAGGGLATSTSTNTTQLLVGKFIDQRYFFDDYSLNNFTLTNNGGVSAATLYPPINSTSTFNSMYFNGTTQYLTIPNATAITLNTGDFTIEAWVYTTVLNGQNGIFGKRELLQYYGVIFRVLNSTNKLVMQIASDTGNTWAIDANLDFGLPALTINTWYHVALVRNGSSFRIYQNGVGGTIYTYAGLIAHNTAPGYIGKSDGSGGGQFWNGYISNFRIVKGVAVYTNNFTVPTGPLNNAQVANPYGGFNTQGINNNGTSILIAKSSSLINEGNVAVDYSIVPNYMTSAVRPTVNNFFPPIGSTSTYYNSLFFDGTQSLTLTAPQTSLSFGTTGEFTIEMWVYPTALALDGIAAGLIDARAGQSGSPWALDLTLSGGNMYLHMTVNTGGGPTGVTPIPLNNWTHIVFTKQNGAIKYYVNGALDISSTSNANTSPLDAGSATQVIGRNNESGRFFKGYISNLRIVKGLAVYTGPFTIPTRPLTITQTANPYGGSNVQAISTGTYTSLLTILPVNVSNIVDYSTNTSVITIGSGTVSLSTLDPFIASTYNLHSVYFNGNSSLSLTSSRLALGSLLFNGTSQTLTFSAQTALSFGTGDLTIEMWVYPTSLAPDGIYAGLIDARSGSGNTSWNVGLFVSAGNMYAYMQIIGATGNPSGTTIIPLNAWTHIAWTRQSSTFKIFVNGVVDYTASETRAIDAGGTSQTIGRHNEAGRYYRGYISTLRIVKGTAVYTSSFNPLLQVIGNIVNTSLLLLVTSDANKIIDSSSTPVTLTNNGAVSFSSVTVPPAPQYWLYSDHTVESWVYLNSSTITTNNITSNMLIAGTYDGATTTGWEWTINPYVMTLNYRNSGVVISFGTSQLPILSQVIADRGGIGLSPTNTAVTLSPASPLSDGYGSLYFNGTNAQITNPKNSGFDYGSGSFTIESWVYYLGTVASTTIIGHQAGPTPGRSWMFTMLIAGHLYFDWSSNGSYGTPGSFVSSSTAPLNQWNHVAFVRNGTIYTFYINGVAAGSGSMTAGIAFPNSGSLAIGYTANETTSGQSFFKGYISNLRVVKGLAVYTGNFTPTGRLTSTQVAGTNIQAILTASYTSILLAANPAVSSQTFALNTWHHVVFTRQGTTSTMYINGVQTTSTVISGYTDQYTLRLGYIGFTSPTSSYLTGYLSNFRIVNGVAVYTGTNFLPPTGVLTLQQPANPFGGTNTNAITDTNNIRISTLAFSGVTITPYNTNSNMLIGRAGSGITSVFPGYLSNFRIVNGTAVYTGNFTAPRAPLSLLKNTSLLIAASSWYVDKSPYNFQISTGTVSSVPAITKFTPYKIPGEYNRSIVGGSIYFNTTTAAGQNLSLGSPSSLALGSGNYTVECWIYINAYNTLNSVIIDWRTNAGTTAGVPVLYLLANGTIQWQNTGGTGLLTSAVTSPISDRIILNTWNHIAMVRYNSMLYMYINGVVVANVADSTALTIQTLFINSPITASNQTLFGYVSNVRILAGTALYVPSIVVPTTTLTVLPDTALLALKTNATLIKDNSQNNFFIADSTSTTIQRVFTPFGGSGSAFFGNRNTFLTISSSTNSAFALGTNDFTLEAWVYQTERNIYFGSLIVGALTYNVSLLSSDWHWIIDPSGYLNFQSGYPAVYSATSNVKVPLNVWTHVSFVRNFGSPSFYINGKSAGGSLSNSTRNSAAGSLWWDNDVDLYKNTSVYISTSTVSMYDNYTSDEWSFLHNGQQDYTIDLWVYSSSLWGGYAWDDPLINPSSTSIINTGHLSTPIGLYITDFGAVNLATNFAPYYMFTVPPGQAPNDLAGTWGTKISGSLWYGISNATEYIGVYAGAGSIQPNIWNHIAVTFKSSTKEIKLFINGKNQSVTVHRMLTNGATASGSFSYPTGPSKYTLGVGGAPFSGYMTNIRITKSIVYTTDYTIVIPTPNITNAITLLLVNSNANKFLDSSDGNRPLRFDTTANPIIYSPTFSNNVPSIVVNAVGSTLSLNFNGSSYLTVPSNPIFAFGTGDFTVECWWYQSVANTDRGFLSSIAATTGTPAVGIQLAGNGAFTGLNTGGSFDTFSWTLPLSQWNHVAFVRINGIAYAYVNGVLASSGPTTLGNNLVGSGFVIGCSYTNNFSFLAVGYISNVRVVKGLGVYNNNFIKPTSTLTNITNTVLLLNVNSSGNYLKDDSTTNFSPITITGNVTYNASTPFSSGGSLAFDQGGAASRLTLPSSTAFNLTGNFTLEAWIYPTYLLSGGNGIFDARVTGASALPWAWYVDGPTKALAFFNGTYYIGTTPITTSTWTHIAATRSGSNFRMYVNGILDYTASITGAISPGSTSAVVGIKDDNLINYKPINYITNLRIVNGTALYTGTFTVPTLELQTTQQGTGTYISAIFTASYVSLLTAQHYAIADISVFNNSITNNNAVSVSNTVKPALTFDLANANFINTQNINIGGHENTTATAFRGYMSNLHVVKGQAKYGNAFKTPTTDFTTLTNSVLLTMLSTDTRFVDYSANAFTITNTSTSLQGFSPFDVNYSTYFNGTSYISIGDSLPLNLSSSTNWTIETWVNPLGNYSVNNSILFAKRNASAGAPLYNSLYFNGTSNLTVTSSNSPGFVGAGEDTIECWVNFSSFTLGSRHVIFQIYNGNSTYNGTSLTYRPTDGNTGTFIASIGNSSGINSQEIYSNTVIVVTNKWYHVALQANNQGVYATQIVHSLYLNGTPIILYDSFVSIQPPSDFYNPDRSADIVLSIGAALSTYAGTVNLIGYISNFRIVNGIALYNSLVDRLNDSVYPIKTVNNVPETGHLTYTGKVNIPLLPFGTTQLANPSGGINTRALSTSSYTTLLVGRFTGGLDSIVDYSDYNLSIVNNSVVVSTLANNQVGSLYFNGSSYLTAPVGASTFGTGDFTVECWFYKTAALNSTLLSNVPSGVDINYWALSTYADGHCQFTIRDASQIFVTGSIITAINTWVHLAVTRTSGLVKLFVNGVLDNSGTITKTVTARITVIGAFLYTGYLSYFQGYMSNVRIVTGAAVYTTAFIKPYAPLSNTQTSNTSGLPSIAIPSLNYSASFDGSTQYLYVPTTTDMVLGTGDFTIELWVYLNAAPASGKVFLMLDFRPALTPSTAAGYINFYVSPSLQIGANLAAFSYGGGTALALSTWYHVALVRRNSNSNIYINGSAIGGGITDTNNYLGATNRPVIGTDSNSVLAAGYSLNGYISNLRIVKGISAYAGNFTKPTSSLTLSQVPSGNILRIPASLNTLTYKIFSITGNTGNNATNGYIKLGNGNIYFNLYDIWSAECWFYSPTGSSFGQIMGTRSSLNAGYAAFLFAEVNNVLQFYSSSNASSWDLFNTPVNTVATITPNTWHHIAVSRTTTTMYVYYDGTVSLTRDLTGIGFSGSQHNIYMGAGDYLNQGSDSWTGYIADFRFVTGETPYTGTNFTPPSIPLEATQEKSGQIGPIVFTTSTRFLVGGTLPTPGYSLGLGALTIADRSYYQNPEVTRWPSFFPGSVGTSVAGILGGTTPGFPTLTPNYTTLLTLQSPIVANTSNNNVSIVNIGTVLTTTKNPFGAAATSLLTANFVDENISIVDSSGNSFAITNVGGVTTSTALNPFAAAYGSATASYEGYLNSGTGFLGFFDGTTYSTSTTALTSGIWSHVAYTYDGTAIPPSVNIYVNGVRVHQTSTLSIQDNQETLYIGGASGVIEHFYGNMSNFRIIKDYSLYLGSYFGDIPKSILTTNINTIPYPNTSTIASSVSLLTLQRGSINDNSTYQNTVSFGGTPTTVLISPFGSSTIISTYFNSGTNYLTISAQNALSLGVGDFTVEVWVYPTAPQSTLAGYYSSILDARASVGGIPWIVSLITIAGGALKAIFYDGTQRTASTTVPLGTWTHIAWTRTNSILRIFVNGVVDYVLTNHTINLSAGTTQYIGRLYDGNPHWYQGYISNLRVVKGTSLYTGNFVPSQIPLTSVAGTSTNLLTNFVDTRAFDYSGNTVIKANTSSVTLVNSVAKNNLYSIGFNGSTDFITVSSSTGFIYNANDFTWELWVYPTSPIWATTSTYFIEHGINGGSLRYANNKVFYYNISTATSTASTVLSISSSTWTHIAVARSSGLTSLFVNGSFVVNTPDYYSYNTATIVTIGNTSTASRNYFQGYIEDLRITKGVARYSSTFVPPIKLSNR